MSVRFRARSRSDSLNSLSSGIESAYEPEPDSGCSRSPSPANSQGSVTEADAAPSSPTPRNSRAEYTRYAHLVTSLAARDAEDLSARLAGSGVWSSQFWQAASSPAYAPYAPYVAPRWATAPSSTPAAPEEGESEVEPEVDELDELDDDSDPDVEDIPHRLRASHPAPAEESTRLAASLAHDDPATRWPLHPRELGAPPGTLPALRECAARMLRRDHLRFPEAPEAESSVSWRRAQRLANLEMKAARRRVPYVPPEPEEVSLGGQMEIDLDDVAAFVPDPECDYLPPTLPERVAAAVDRTLAALIAFRPKMTANQRGEGGMGWSAVLAAAAMSVDRSVVEKTERRLKAIFPNATEGTETGIPATSTLAQRLDLVDEAGGFPRAPASDFAKDLYTLPPLRMTRRVKNGVYKRSKKDADERIAVSKRHAARAAEAARQRAEYAKRVAENKEKRAARIKSEESYAARGRERARQWRERKKMEQTGSAGDTGITENAKTVEHAE